MFSALRTRFGIPGLISTVALVFAMTGGAFAAKYLITSPNQIKPSVLKKLKGPKGATGATGAQGPAGLAGAAGEKGANGTNGTNGKDGTNGTDGTDGEDGKSVEVDPATAFDCEELGGAIVKEEGATEAEEIEVCNGKQGEDGEPGEDGTFSTEPLPPGETLTGSWAITGSSAGQEVLEPISFPIQLASFLVETEVHFGRPGKAVFKDTCPATNVALPTAVPGHLCVYEGSFNEGAPKFEGIYELFFGNLGASQSGALLYFKMGGAGYAFGSWAVTGCSDNVGEPFPCP
jgi:Collagen triple helix repeat (20 copies)